ncbi:MAG: hypothetical protein WCP22_10380 [Chlamydiota bacterium]
MNIKVSFNLKLLILTAGLLLVLAILIFKAIMIRQKQLNWLQNLNRQVAPDGNEAAGKFPAGAASLPAVSFDAPEAESTPTPPKPKEESEIDRAIAKVCDALDGLSDYDPAKRAAAEEVFCTRFESLIQKCALAERSGQSSDIMRKIEALFQKMACLGYPYHFQQSRGKDQFIERLSAEWSKLPYVSRWAYLRMLGIVGGDKARAALRLAMVEGVFEDEAAIALLRAGDAESLPILIDYIARGRIKGDRYQEIKMVVRRTDNPRVMEGLIGFLDRTDPSICSAALLLIEDYASQSRTAPKETSPSDKRLKQKWAQWWSEARGAYRPTPEDERGLVALSLVTGFDMLPKGGQFDRSRFMALSEEIDSCCRDLASLELPIHRRGELALYRIARITVESYDAGDAYVHQVLDQYLGLIVGEVQKICMRQRFPDSAERTAHLKWAEGWMEKGKLPAVVFLIRMSGIYGDKGTATTLLRYAQSWVSEMRRAAVISMGLLGAPQVTDELAKMLSAKEISWEEGERMVVGLERIGDEKAVETLVDVLRKSKSVLAYQAYVSLRKFRGESSIQISLEEFEQRREGLIADYDVWLKALKGKKRREGR